jgi:hypothetical protein
VRVSGGKLPAAGGAEPGQEVVSPDDHGIISSGKTIGCNRNFNFILFQRIPKLKTQVSYNLLEYKPLFMGGIEHPENEIWNRRPWRLFLLGPPRAAAPHSG